MAGFNPFKKFRVYQKYALAALGIMAMISFVILPSYFMLQRDGRAGAEGIIATCRRAGYGNVDYFLVQKLRENHRQLGAFYNLLASQLSQSVGGDFWEFRMRYPTLARIQQSFQQGTSEEALIQNWLLTRYAQEKGMIVPNSLIVKRLQTITNGDISNSILDSICQQLGLSDHDLIYLLRQEMLATGLQSSFFRSTIATPPLERWSLYQRVNRSLTAEVAVIAVESFQNEVKEPSDAELKKFFEENKNRIYNPNLPESGFAIPAKFAFQIVDATPGEQLLASITDEEIANYYEENKERFLRQSASPFDSQGRPGSMPNFDSSTLFPTIPGGGRSGTLLPSLDSLSDPGLNFDLLEPLQERDEEQGVKDEELSNDPPSDPLSQLTGSAVYRPVAYRQDDEPLEEEMTDLEIQEETPPVLDEAPNLFEGIVTLEDEPLAGASVLFFPNDEEAAPASGVTDEEGKYSLDMLQVEETPVLEELPIPDEVSGETSHSDEAPTFDPAILYQPLEEVENTIRQILANQRADAAIKELEGKMRSFYAASRVGNPEPLDLTALAAEHHLNITTVEEPLSIYEVQQHESWQNSGNRAFLIRMFQEAPAPYEVIVGQQAPQFAFSGSGPVESVGWVVKSESRRVPEFTDTGIKELVRGRWLTVHARELAENRAKELAELANQSKDLPLSESLADQGVPVVETNAFTWFARSSAQAGLGRVPLMFGEVGEKGVPRGTADYSNVHIRAPGVAFMETAYSLQPGESGVAVNQPQMLAFVIRLVESSPDEELLWRFFVSAQPADYFEAGKQESQFEIMEKWIEGIETNVGFQWINRPDSQQFRDEE